MAIIANNHKQFRMSLSSYMIVIVLPKLHRILKMPARIIFIGRMISMVELNKEEMQEFINLKQYLIDSTSSEEIKYYSEQIHLLLDKAENGSVRVSKFSDDERELYDEYMKKLHDADNMEDIQLYEEKILNLINKSDKN